jgi:hypothetical protein
LVSEPAGRFGVHRGNFDIKSSDLAADMTTELTLAEKHIECSSTALCESNETGGCEGERERESEEKKNERGKPRRP